MTASGSWLLTSWPELKAAITDLIRYCVEPKMVNSIAPAGATYAQSLLSHYTLLLSIHKAKIVESFNETLVA